MEKARCSYCFNTRYCIWRNGTTQCLSCTLEVASCLLNDLVKEMAALGKVTSAGDEVPTRPCACGRVGAMVGKICASCAAEELHRRLESASRELEILRTCAQCGETAVYMWKNQLPLCGLCALAAAIS